ncbi:MAG: carbohydrate kinase family protein [Spirochaetia bacterium]|jgi:sugar/nucleoside kinase (ribokinase family)|nr:carbohydrate kinase family protein [Spirochaetia bacterium]
MGVNGAGLVAVGHVLLDYVGRAYGNAAKLCETLSTPAHVSASAMADIVEALGEDGDAAHTWRAGGGSAIIAMAWAKLGLPAALVGCVGRDEGGALLRQLLGSVGIKLFLSESDKPTGRFCRVSTAKGSKIIASPAAARDIRRFDPPDSFVSNAWVLHLDGLLIDEPAWLEGIAKRAKAAGMAVSLDVSTPFNAAKNGESLIEFSKKFCDFVFANENEWELLGKAASEAAFRKSETIWVVKRGERGASALDKGCWIDEPAARVLELEDDVGAGDAFAAGFLAAKAAGCDVSACLAGGNQSASLLLVSRESFR